MENKLWDLAMWLVAVGVAYFAIRIIISLIWKI